MVLSSKFTSFRASGIEESGSDTGRYAVEAAAGMIDRIDSEMQDIVNDLLDGSEELASKMKHD